MNLGLHIFNFLQENGNIELPGFGVFSIQKKSAAIDETSSKLLPPSLEIQFTENRKVFNSDLSKYIAKLKEANLFLVQSQIKEEVNSWLHQLDQNQKLSVEELGDFSKENDKIVLSQTKGFEKTPQFFGLEEINLEEITLNKTKEIPVEYTDNQYVFNQSILWIFLLILPIGALIFLGLNYQEEIFGKKSFDISTKTSTHRIENKKDSAKTDSVKVLPKTTSGFSN